MGTKTGIAVLLFVAHLSLAAPGLLTIDGVTREFGELLSASKPEQAEALARRLLAQEESAQRLESPEIQKALDLLLEAFRYRADRANPEVEDVGRRALDLREKLQGPDATDTARTLRLWAVALVRMGNYSQGRTLVDRSVRIFERAEEKGVQFSRNDISQYSKSLSDLAEVLSTMADWHDAKRALLKSIALKEQLSLTSAGLGVAWLELGRVEHDLGDHQLALERFAKARAILTTATQQDEPSLMQLLQSEGICQMDLGDLLAARATLQEVLKHRELAYGPNFPEVADSLDDLSQVERRLKHFDVARDLIARAISIEHKNFSPLHPDIAVSEAHLAEALFEGGNATLALPHALEAERIARQHLSLSVPTLPEREATLFALKRITALPIAVSVALDQKGDTIAPAYDALVRSRAIVLDELASRHGLEAAVSEDGAAIAKLRDELNAARDRLARLSVATGPETGTRDQQLQRAIEQRDAADFRLASASVRYRRNRFDKTSGLKEVVAALPDDAALLSFFHFGRLAPGTTQVTDEYAAFVVTKDRAPNVISLGSAADIGAAVGEVRAKLALESAAPGVATRRNELAYRAAAEKLRKLIWDPLDRDIAGIKRIFIVPDGALHTVNFAALPESGSQTRYLIERGSLFHYLSAERDLVTAGSLESSGTGLLAVGNPSFDRPELARGMTVAARRVDQVARNTTAPVFRGVRSNCSGMQSMRFADLPSSGKEIENIAKLWKRALPDGGEVIELSGELAGPDRFKAMAPGRQTIHLAVHGFVAGTDCADPARNENPLLLTGLALAGANRRGGATQEEDGILTAEEIAALDLRGVEWAVLSACDTGLGKTSSSEGVFGLRRAFQVAGAHTVIMSLWPVEDQVTTDWMQSLYDHRLNKHMDTANSVRQADLDALKRRRAAGLPAHPFYWAAFVAVGDWR